MPTTGSTVSNAPKPPKRSLRNQAGGSRLRSQLNHGRVLPGCSCVFMSTCDRGVIGRRRPTFGYPFQNLVTGRMDG